MNSIPELQNQPRQIEQLAAQRQLYSDAKTTLAIQIILTIGVGIVSSFVLIWTKGNQNLEQPLEQGAAFLSFIIALLDVIVLEAHQKKLAQQAAKIQEAFDCEVLSLDWQEVKLGSRPEEEIINDSAEKHRRLNPDFDGLKNWYSPSVGQVPQTVARILCQRSNVWWDAGLRRRYATAISIILPTLLVAIFVIGLLKGVKLSDFVFALLIPLQPAFLWVIREYKKQRETSSALDRLHQEASRLWEKACKQELSDEQLTQASRDLQNEIYDHRRAAPFIFDWVYEKLKNKDEEQMNKNSGDLVKDYLEKGKHK